jgi:hypothetical protein
MKKEIILSAEETMNYVKNEVEKHDTLEISYNRIYVPAEVLDIEHKGEAETESLNLMLQLKGELLSDTVQLDLVQIKDDIIEIRHINSDDREIIIVIEET